ncbi:tripartite motif-containing protein 2-like [Anneissia japonica]|uniref:tripartite motif-containing protein 2-like n=1 Tax=Anneissia japonica TaxID=1529436 RepID=UPI001425526B|nr:tripartite motif-containing protein 2-like [Anneissia japonica]
MATYELNQFSEDIDKLIECAICLKRIQNPKSLNCQHNFCLACLEDWVKKWRKLTCPTCSRSYPIPEGGLQKLPTNIFLNNLLETLEQYDKSPTDYITKCVCGKAEEYYCQDCRHCLCSSCTDNHKILPFVANHKLHTVEDVYLMTPQEFAMLNTPLCSLHSKPLELYCQDCKTSICKQCIFIEHKEGKHKTISYSEAFKTFKETSATLKEAVHDCKNKLQGGLKAVTENTIKLNQCRGNALNEIDILVQDIIQRVTENGNKLKKEVEAVYKMKKQVNDEQVDEMRIMLSDVNIKLCFLNLLLNNDEATAMKSIETVIAALQDRINEMPKTEPKDNGKILFTTDKRHISSLQHCDIGKVEMKTKAVESLTLKRGASASQGQRNSAKLIKKNECDVDENHLAATWTHPTRETNITQLKDDNGYYVATEKSARPGVCRFNVGVDDKPFKQSPMVIKEKKGLVNTIQIYQKYKLFGLVLCEDECLLVSCGTNEMYKYKQSGEYTAKITLPKGVEIFKMCKMKNGNIAVSDECNKCIKIVKMNGEVVKSIGQGILRDPAGIHVDESSNVVYVADWKNKCVYVFDIESGRMIRKVMSPGKTINVHDVALTKQGHILALERDTKQSCNNKLQGFSNEGLFMRVLIKGDEHGIAGFREVVVDDDDNIILLSKQKIYHFSSDGSFIKRIDKPEDGITDLGGVCLISQHPWRVAVVNNGDKTIKIYNY